jgi:hypothetical protein
MAGMPIRRARKAAEAARFSQEAEAQRVAATLDRSPSARLGTLRDALQVGLMILHLTCWLILLAASKVWDRWYIHRTSSPF